MVYIKFVQLKNLGLKIRKTVFCTIKNPHNPSSHNLIMLCEPVYATLHVHAKFHQNQSFCSKVIIFTDTHTNTHIYIYIYSHHQSQYNFTIKYAVVRPRGPLPYKQLCGFTNTSITFLAVSSMHKGGTMMKSGGPHLLLRRMILACSQRMWRMFRRS